MYTQSIDTCILYHFCVFYCLVMKSIILLLNVLQIFNCVSWLRLSPKKGLLKKRKQINANNITFRKDLRYTIVSLIDMTRHDNAIMNINM